MEKMPTLFCQKSRGCHDKKLDGRARTMQIRGVVGLVGIVMLPLCCCYRGARHTGLQPAHSITDAV